MARSRVLLLAMATCWSAGTTQLPPQVDLVAALALRPGSAAAACTMAPCVADGSCAIDTDFGPLGHPINEHLGASGVGHGDGARDTCERKNGAWCRQGGANGVRVCGPASSSTVGWGGEPGHAIDGNTDGDFGGGSCSHTDNSPPWWQLDLGSAQQISRVVIHHRTDCCQGRMSGAAVVLSETSDFAAPKAVQCAPIVDDRSQPTEVSACPAHAVGRFVTVSNAGSNGPVVLCEVEVWGRLAAGGSGAGVPHPLHVEDACAGDANGDAAVDVADLLLILAAFGGSECGRTDLDGDCDTDVRDVLTCLSDFGARC